MAFRGGGTVIKKNYGDISTSLPNFRATPTKARLQKRIAVKRANRICLPTDRSRGGVVMQTRTGGRLAMPKQQRTRREIVSLYGNTRMIPSQIRDPGNEEDDEELKNPGVSTEDLQKRAQGESYRLMLSKSMGRLNKLKKAGQGDSPQAVQLENQIEAMEASAKKGGHDLQNLFPINDDEEYIPPPPNQHEDLIMSDDEDEDDDDAPRVDPPRVDPPRSPKGKEKEAGDLFSQMEEADDAKKYRTEVERSAKAERRIFTGVADGRTPASPFAARLNESMALIENEPFDDGFIEDQWLEMSKLHEHYDKQEKMSRTERTKLQKAWIAYESFITTVNEANRKYPKVSEGSQVIKHLATPRASSRYTTTPLSSKYTRRKIPRKYAPLFKND
jgi:hypothetical protein